MEVILQLSKVKEDNKGQKLESKNIEIFLVATGWVVTCFLFEYTARKNVTTSFPQ